MSVIDNPAIPLSFVAGPAMLANVCAILQNGVNIRYGHGVEQWRALQAVAAGRDSKWSGLYGDDARALDLSGRRLGLQLRAIELLVLGACVFGLTSFLALIWSLLASSGASAAAPVSFAMFASGTLGLALLCAVAVTIARESYSARQLMRLHVAARSSTAQPEAAE